MPAVISPMVFTRIPNPDTQPSAIICLYKGGSGERQHLYQIITGGIYARVRYTLAILLNGGAK